MTAASITMACRVSTSSSAAEAAKAINELLSMDSSDSDKLLEVIDDYFHPPNHIGSTEEEEEEDEIESLGFGPGTYCSSNTIMQTFLLLLLLNLQSVS